MENPAPQFTTDWFSRSIPVWKNVLTQLAANSRPLRVLEVGVFEGRSTCWLLQNFCTTPESTIVAVDSFQGGIEHRGMELSGLRARFESNVKAVGSLAKVEIREGSSKKQLASLIAEKAQLFDFVSIDGSHQAADVLADGVLGFELLRKGGVMVFDDYLWSPMRPGTENPLLLPKIAIDAFTTAYSQKSRVVPGAPLYQLMVQKLSE